MKISFVIPAFNEEGFIAQTLRSIHLFCQEKLDYEVIVVDHNSTDSTAELASSNGAKVISGKEKNTIGGLRNLGVENATGQVIIFIDADITLTAGWQSAITSMLEKIEKQPKLITGSLPTSSDDTPNILKVWFDSKIKDQSPNHLGTGHLIVAKSFFEEIGGFNEKLETSEEFNFCIEAKKLGGTIEAAPEAEIIHHGTPKTLKQFFLREVWHGRGDFTSFKSFKNSRIAILSVIQSFLLLLLLYSLLQPLSLLYPVALIVAFSIFCAYAKYKTVNIRILLSASFTFFIYITARSCSPFSLLLYKRFIRTR